MSDNQVAARGQVLRQPLHGDRARGRIEIDHHVAAEDHVLFPSHGISGLEKIDPLKLQALPYFTLDPTGPSPDADAFLKIALQQFRRHGLDGIHSINTLLSVLEHAPGDIRGGDLPLEWGISA